jgi:hypothetical protein
MPFEISPELKRFQELRTKAIWKAFDFMSRRLRRVGKKGLTRSGLVEAVLYRLTPAEREALHSDSCYYYESREGPFDWLVDLATDRGIIKTKDDFSKAFALGPHAVPPRHRSRK